MSGNGIPRSALDLPQGVLELVVGERLDLPAAVADEMVMVLAACVNRLEVGNAGANVDSLDEALLAQLFEHSVDARDSDPTLFSTQPVEDLLSGEAARLPPEELDDGPACTAAATTPRVEGCDRRFRPGGSGARHHAHSTNDSGSRLW